MKYALDNGIRVEAAKGIKALCPVCGAEMIAKCGEYRIAHWAHKSMRICDKWFEPETEWHRIWKNYYPAEWQEVLMREDSTGQKHVADVHTKDGLTIEFQHSALKPEEQRSREGFYKPLVWVVDGTRTKNDFTRFHKAIYKFRHTEDPYLVYTDIDDGYLPVAWVRSSVPVIFDFSAHETLEDVEGYRKVLYCLLPQKQQKGRYAKLIKFTRQEFVEKTTSGEWSSFVQQYIDTPNKYHLLQQIHAAQPLTPTPVKKAPRWKEDFRYVLALIGFLLFILSIASYNARRRKLKKAYVYNRRATFYGRNRQYRRK